MGNKVVFKKDAKDKLLSGVNLLADAVASTMGAKGQTVIYQMGVESNGIPMSTKDGVTVAKEITSEDRLESIAINIVREAARKTANKAGDGTTTSTVLAQAILNSSMDITTGKRSFIKGMEDAAADTLKYLDDISEELTEEGIEFVASISTNSDEELGPLVSEAFKQVGEYGTVGYGVNHIGIDSYYQVEQGAQIPRGYLDPGFINDDESQKVILEKPYIFMSTSKFDSPRQLEFILKKAVDNNRSLLVIAECEPQVSSTLLMNKVKHGYKFNVIKPPHFGLLARETMEDLALLTGCQLHGTHLGDAADVIDESFLGTCDIAQTDRDNTVLRVSDGPNLSGHIKHLQHLIEVEGVGDRKKQLRSRLATIAGGIGMIYVGAPSEAAINEKVHRVEDAIYAVHAAKQEGILPGGGVALRDASNKLSVEKIDSKDLDYVEGYNMLLEAIKTPYNVIIENADLDVPKDLPVGEGLDVMTGDEVNMKEAGIIDPTLATKEGLINAVSVSKTLLSTGVVIQN